MNVRDSTSEDNVRKRPFTTKMRPAHPYGLPESGTEIQKKVNEQRKRQKNLAVTEKSVYLQRQSERFDYPGKFPERASRKRHYPF